MPTIWTISANGIQPSGGNGLELVGCHIAIVDDAFGKHYAFEYPSQQIAVQTPGATLPSIPFSFPEFNSGLAGSQVLNWLIRVTSGGPSATTIGGTWSNPSSPHAFDPADVDDTFTAQAGVGVDPCGDEEKDKGAAASASQKQ